MRWVSGSPWTSSMSWRNSSRLCTLSAVVVPCSARCTSIESTPIACVRRRWFSERLRAIRYSHGPHVQRALVGEHRVERGGEDLLEHVLGVLARAEHVPAEREQARLVAGHERLVGGLVAASGQRDEALVGLDPQQRRRAAKLAVRAGVGEGRGFHEEKGLPLKPGGRSEVASHRVAAIRRRSRSVRCGGRYPGRDSNPQCPRGRTAFKAADFASLSTRAGVVIVRGAQGSRRDAEYRWGSPVHCLHRVPLSAPRPTGAASPDRSDGSTCPRR